MNHAVRLRFQKKCIHCALIGDIDLVKEKFFTADFFECRQHIGMTVAEIIGYHHLMTCLQQCDTSMRTDKAGTSADNDSHEATSFFDNRSVHFFSLTDCRLAPVFQGKPKPV